jgi:hypothetical protein
MKAKVSYSGKSIERLLRTLSEDAVETILGESFTQELKEDTPKGYSGKLKESVVAMPDKGDFVVGYEREVETGGMPEVERIPESKRTVLTWVPSEELETVIEGSIKNFSEVPSVLLPQWFNNEVRR